MKAEVVDEVVTRIEELVWKDWLMKESERFAKIRAKGKMYQDYLQSKGSKGIKDMIMCTQ